LDFVPEKQQGLADDMSTDSNVCSGACAPTILRIRAMMSAIARRASLNNAID